jgi:hypothetical protein
MTRPQVLVVGLGGLGSWVLELLARSEGLSHIVGADISEEWGRRKVYNVAAAALLQGYTPRLEFVRMDLGDVDSTAETIARLQPQVIVNCATLQTWWVRKVLPPGITDRLNQAGSGPWVPTHLALSRKLMLAARASGWRGHVINSGIPDISNAVLGKRGLAPTMGLGNIDLVVPVLRMGVSQRLRVPVRSVSVYAIFHHFHVSHFRHHMSGAPPYFLRLMVDDKDVTGEFDTDVLLHQVSKDRFSGEPLNPVVAASGVKNALALLRDSGLPTHTPGPQGLAGGYPVRVGGAGAEVVLPHGVTEEHALAINTAGQRGDGVERIEDDGTVVLTDQAVQVMKEVVGIDLAPYPFDDCDEWAHELITRFRALAEEHGGTS